MGHILEKHSTQSNKISMLEILIFFESIKI